MKIYRAGNEPTDKELYKLQVHCENWSDELDGDDGVIATIRNEQAERRIVLKAFRGLAWVFGGLVALQAVIATYLMIHLGHL